MPLNSETYARVLMCLCVSNRITSKEQVTLTQTSSDVHVFIGFAEVPSPLEGQRCEAFFPDETDCFFVAEVVRLRKRLSAKARILTNPATKMLHSFAGRGEKWAQAG